MKHLDDTSSMCPECTGNGCKQCMGTGNMPKEVHIQWLQDMVKRKNREIEELDEQLDLQHQLIKSLKEGLAVPLTPERVIQSAKQDNLI